MLRAPPGERFRMEFVWGQVSDFIVAGEAPNPPVSQVNRQEMPIAAGVSEVVLPIRRLPAIQCAWLGALVGGREERLGQKTVRKTNEEKDMGRSVIQSSCLPPGRPRGYPGLSQRSRLCSNRADIRRRGTGSQRVGAAGSGIPGNGPGGAPSAADPPSEGSDRPVVAGSCSRSKRSRREAQITHNYADEGNAGNESGERTADPKGILQGFRSNHSFVESTQSPCTSKGTRPRPNGCMFLSLSGFGHLEGSRLNRKSENCVLMAHIRW